MAPLDAPPPDPAPAVATVTVRAARLPPAQGEAAFSVIRLDQVQLQDQPGVDQALSQVPGLSLFRRTDSSGANPTTQGMSLRAIAPSGAGRTLVTLDGVPQNDPFGGWVIWNALSPLDLGGASVIRGAGTGPYGAGALTGTVALEERVDAPGAVAADLSAGELKTLRGAATADVAAGPGDLFVSASATGSGGWIPVRQGRGPVDRPLNLDAREASARWSADFGPGVLAARVSGYDENRGTGVAGGVAGASGSSESLTWAAQPTPDRAGWRLQLWARQSDFSQTSLSVAPGRATATPANDQFSTPANGIGFNAALRRATPRWSWELGLDARQAQGEDHELFRFVGSDFTRLRIAGGKQAVMGVYAEGSRVEGPWLLAGGVRLDYWRSWNGKRIETDRATGAVTLTDRPGDRDGVTPTARAGARRDLGAGYYARAAAYAGFRPPTLNELHRPFRVGNDITESNPALQPERLYGGEVGVGRERGGLSLDADVFVNRLVDPITNVTLGAGPGTFPRAGFIPAGGTFRMRENAGVVNAVGFEADAHQRLSERLTLRAALSVTDARVDGGDQAPQLTGKRPAEAPVWTATAGVIWTPADRFSLDAQGRFESNRFEDDQNLRRLGSGLTIDARARWRLDRRTEAYVDAQNLFGAQVATGAAADGTLSYAAPRVVSVGISWRR
ncbi:MAG: TonB-dependent receptor [Proteobacteria bacterium]|nr:TonB-dependent receptor [Pseudomonadota bacterium]